jgi:hypothetical protein
MPTVSKAVKATTTKITEERLKRLRHQNAKLSIEVKRLRGQLAPVEEVKRAVLAANTVVKQRLLALPSKLALQLSLLTNPAEIEALLREQLTDTINELAYEQERAGQNAA